IEYKGRGQENETNKDFLLTLILTGLFRNECESLHWKNIDLEEGTLSFINPYNNVYYKIYMGNFLWHLMKKRRIQNKGEWVFPSVKSESGHIINISKFRKKINEQCNLSFTFQDLRRTFYFVLNHLTNKPLASKRTDQYEEKLDVKNIAHALDMRNRMNKVEQIILGPYRDELIKSIN
ncbi:integrase, partial [Acinetobacter baumannii]|nr:integrase [Acinetobacter baumannii]